MLTLLTSFKNFEGEDAVRQRNALASWRCLAPDVEILLFGNPKGAAEVVREFGLRQFPDVPMFENRLARIDAVFEIAQREGRFDLQAYVNGDMVFGSDFVAALSAISLPRFLGVGRRWTVPVQGELSRECSEEVVRLQETARRDLKIDDRASMDYFCYRRGTFPNLKPLYLGTIAWDNYMVYHCVTHRIPVVDLSHAMVAVHQKHDYVYLNGGRDEFYAGPAAVHNRRCLGGGWERLFVTSDASHVLSDGRVRAARSKEHVVRRVERMRELRPHLFRMLGSWKARHALAWLLKWA